MIQIQFTKGCPNNCEYCYEPKEMEYLDPLEITSKELIQILDMNFLANPKHIEILESFPKKQKYEFICGIDFRRLTKDICNLMKEKGFIKVRWAWDYNMGQQKVQKKTLEKFIKAKYKPKELSIFMLVNWEISYEECCKKLDLLKIWNVKVNDCCFDGGYPIDEEDYNLNLRFEGKQYWQYNKIIRFRRKCRKHNQMVLFGIDPELKYDGMKPLTILS